MRLSLRRCLGWASFLALAAPLLAAGCSQNGTVEGKVLYQGQPLKGGNVTFFSPTGKTVGSPIDKDGTYSVADFPPGPATITVETETVKQRAGVRKYSPPPGAPEPPGGFKGPSGGDIHDYVKIPIGYGDPQKSGLTYDVHGGKQSHDIELK